MDRRQWVLRGLCLTVIAAFLSGCPDSSTPKVKKPLSPVEIATSEKKSLLKDWPEPAAVLLLTGDMDGYLEPCGCSPTQSGGMTRRADLFRIIREEKRWPVAGLECGNILKRHRSQDEVKFGHILNALKELNYQGTGLGISDLRLKPDLLISKQPADPTQTDAAVRFLSSNVTFFDVPDLGTPLRSHVFNVGAVKVGVTSVLANSLIPEVAPKGAKSNISAADPVAAIKTTLAKLNETSPDVLVLLSQGTVEEAKTFAKEFPQFQIILTTGGPEDPSGDPVAIGDTLVIQPGHKGKYVGVLGFYPNEKNRFRYELVELDNRRFQEVAAMRNHMRAYQQELEQLKLSESNELVIPHPSGRQYVGVDQCKGCHTKAFDVWESSAHAHAYVTLEKGAPGKEATFVPRIHDPECLACHVVGWSPQEVLRYDSGFFNISRTPHLAGQQCENCHNPGSRHVELETNRKRDPNSVPAAELKTEREFVRLSLETAKKVTCVKCHDGDNSPKYKFDEFWDMIKHPGKD